MCPLWESGGLTLVSSASICQLVWVDTTHGTLIWLMLPRTSAIATDVGHNRPMKPPSIVPVTFTF
jgi:hypothetical protein